MRNILHLFSSWIRLGTRNQSDDFSRRIVLTNQIAILLLLIASPYILLFFSLSRIHGLLGLPIVILFILTPIANKFGKFTTARLLVVIGGNLGAFFYAAAFGREAGIQFLFFAYVGLPVLIFETEESAATLFCMFLPILCFLLLEISGYSVVPRISARPVYIKAIYYAAIPSVLAIIVLYLRFFVRAMESSKRKLVAAYTDLKESKRTAENLSQHQAFSTLVRGISHEFRNPMAMLKSRAELVEDHLDDQKAVKDFAEMIKRNISRLDTILKPMLDYGSPNVAHSPQKFSAEEMLIDLAELSSARCREKRLDLVRDFAPGLSIFGDRDYLFQAFLNLIVNAIQYTPENGSIYLRSRPTSYADQEGVQRDGVCISVQDTGVGIPQENMTKIFDPYFTTKKTSQNLGLGLSMAFRVVSENNGQIRVESPTGEGAKFDVFLPSQ
jgi:signal transduction histidine kinase